MPFLVGKHFVSADIHALINFIAYERIEIKDPSTLGGGIWKHSFISTVRPTVHTNPTPKLLAFRKRSSYPRNHLQKPASRSGIDGKTFWKRSISKKRRRDNYVISLTKVSSNKNSKWPTLITAFHILWRSVDGKLWRIFTVKMPFSNSSGVQWTGHKNKKYDFLRKFDVFCENSLTPSVVKCAQQSFCSHYILTGLWLLKYIWLAHASKPGTIPLTTCVREKCSKVCNPWSFCFQENCVCVTRQLLHKSAWWSKQTSQTGETTV